MLTIKSKQAKRVLVAHIDADHLRFLVAAGRVFGEMVIQVPEDKILRRKLEEMKDADLHAK